MILIHFRHLRCGQRRISTCDGDSNDTGHPMDVSDTDNDGVRVIRIAAMVTLGGRTDWMIGSRMALTKTAMGLMRWPPFPWRLGQSVERLLCHSSRWGRYCRYLQYPSEVFTAQDPSNLHLVSGPGFNVCGLDASGQLTCYGDDYYGVVSNAPTTPQVDVALGYYHACSVDENGVVSCWGSNSSGQTSVPSLGTVVQVALTDNSSCARESTGQVTCWGNGAYVPTAPSNVYFDSSMRMETPFVALPVIKSMLVRLDTIWKTNASGGHDSNLCWGCARLCHPTGWHPSLLGICVHGSDTSRCLCSGQSSGRELWHYDGGELRAGRYLSAI